MIYLQILKYVVPFIIGGLLVGYVQQQRLEVCKKDNQVCVTANAENITTITALKAEIDKANKSCEARLKSKDALVKKLKKIDDLKGKKNEKANDNANDISNSTILDELNIMWR